MFHLIFPCIIYPVFVLLFVVIPFFSIFQRRERARKSKLPTWKELGEARELLKKGGTANRLQALADAADVIFIGSGMGSLSCAAILAKAGLKVIVLEQHDVVGGATHSFEDGGYEFDVGVHYIGGQLHSPSSLVRRLFSYVSDGQLEFTKVNDTYDVAYNTATGDSIGMTDSGRETYARIIRHFAEDKGVEGVAEAMERYRRFERLGVRAGTIFFLFKMLPPALTRLLYPLVEGRWLKYGARPSSEVLSDECGMNGDDLGGLAGAMTYCYGDYGVQPSLAPWFLHTLVSTHYRGGAFFPTGGSSSFAKTLAAVIVRNGGHVFVRAPVSKIMVAKGRACGVVARGVDMRAKVAVVSGAGFRNTFGCADGDAIGRVPLVSPEEGGVKIREMLQGKSTHPSSVVTGASAGAVMEQPKDKVGASVAMVYLFVGLDRSDEELNIKAQNIWALKDWNHNAAMKAYLKMDLPSDGSRLPFLKDLPCVFLASSSAKDGDWARRHPNKAAMEVLAPIRPEWFAPWAGTKLGNRGDSYKQFKNKWRDLLLKVLYEHYPQTEGRVAFTDVGTPLSNDFYLASIKGEVYALENSAKRFLSSDALVALHPETPLPGLYMTGQDTATVGVVSALFSGLFTACRISYTSFFKVVIGLFID